MGVSMSHSAVVNSSNKLACRTYRHLAKEHRGENIFFSPLAMNSALALMASGSREQTKKQLLYSLGGESAKELNSEYGSLLKHFKKHTSTSAVDTILFLDKFYKMEKKFKEIAKKVYGAKIQQSHLSTDSQQALEQVNTWLFEATDGQVSELGIQVPPYTVLLMANLVYHHSFWKHKFSTALTHEAKFWIDSTNSVNAEFMVNTGKFRYYFNPALDCMTVALPYSDKTVMLIIVPQTVDGLPTVEAEFSKQFLEKTVVNMTEEKYIRIVLPKFHLVESYSLVPTLTASGVTDLFTSKKANLMNVSSRDYHLFVNEFSHKAAIEVNEDGIKKPKKISKTVFSTVRADHPFLFVICDKSWKIIYFMGRLIAPYPS